MKLPGILDSDFIYNKGGGPLLNKSQKKSWLGRTWKDHPERIVLPVGLVGLIFLLGILCALPYIKHFMTTTLPNSKVAHLLKPWQWSVIGGTGLLAIGAIAYVLCKKTNKQT